MCLYPHAAFNHKLWLTSGSLPQCVLCPVSFSSSPTGHGRWGLHPEPGAEIFSSHCHHMLSHRGAFGFLCIIVGSYPFNLEHLEDNACVLVLYKTFLIKLRWTFLFFNSFFNIYLSVDIMACESEIISLWNEFVLWPLAPSCGDCTQQEVLICYQKTTETTSSASCLLGWIIKKKKVYKFISQFINAKMHSRRPIHDWLYSIVCSAIQVWLSALALYLGSLSCWKISVSFHKKNILVVKRSNTWDTTKGVLNFSFKSIFHSL